MFQSQLKRRLTEASQRLGAHPRRLFQTYGKEYLTGFDRMLMDKL